MSAGVLSEHNTYLLDERRNRAYAAALEAVVQRGDRVLDLGCGTGLLGLLALQAGAGHVDAVDSTTLIEMARELATANGFGDRVDHHQIWSTDLELPEAIDVVVCDQADGVFGIECGFLDSLPDARERLGRTDVRVVPASVTPLIVPVRSAKLRQRLDSMASRSEGLDTSALARPAESTVWFYNHEAVEDAGPELAGATVALGHKVDRPVRVAGDLPPDGGAWDALACVFRVELAPGIGFSNSPAGGDAIDRGMAMIPLPPGCRPTHVDVALYPGSGILRWRITTPEGEIQRSTLDGLLDAALLNRLEPGRTPRPTEKGALAAEVLSAADGARVTDDLRAALPERHRSLVDVLLSDGYLA